MKFTLLERSQQVVFVPALNAAVSFTDGELDTEVPEVVELLKTKPYVSWVEPEVIRTIEPEQPTNKRKR